ncbi:MULTISPECIES: TonB-dependent siderophore receptor [Acetobacter]|uniref:TonB-dependent siderophore receptor n=1 Tax=Acetobacter tropicalis TaxID=104102 RepID=A0A291PK65_9PROT|nr:MULTISPECIES: TonB-dependent siderophore receptor [Acetobacter]ATJ91832.1 TonB-dependent siderophore receptor [Acetobacter tropicalis]
MGVATYGQTGHHRYLIHALLTPSLLSCAFVTLEPQLACAQATAQGAPLSTVNLEKSEKFSLPAQPLPEAINAFLSQTGWQISYSSSLAQGKMSSPVSGVMPPSQALRTLLSGTGLRARIISTNAAALMADPTNTAAYTPDGAIALGPVSVKGSSESAWGPVQGFVAKRSATATKTDTSLIETPQTINVITAEEMERLKPKRLADALRYTPGVVSGVQPSTTYFDRIRIRGFYSINNIYQDGLQLTPSGTLAVAQVDPYFLERVEVLKGPASVLYGQNGSGGLINMVTKRPTGETFQSGRINIGAYNLYEGNVDVGGTLRDRHFAYRIEAIARKAGLKGDYGTPERFALAPSLKWTPTQKTSLTVMVNLQIDPQGNSSGYLPSVGTILPNVNGRFRRYIYTCDRSYCDYNRKQASFGYDFHQKIIENLEFRQNTRLMYVDTNTHTLSPGSLLADQKTISRTAMYQTATTEGIEVDSNLAYRYALGPIHNSIVAGFDYRIFSSDNMTSQGTSAALNLDLNHPTYGNLTIPTLIKRSDNTLIQEQYGVYAQDQIAFRKWRLLAGLRQDWARTKTDNYLTNSDSTQKDHAFTGRVGLVYLFDFGLSPYVSYSTSFEPTSGTDYFNQAFKPSMGKQIEVGAKYQPKGLNSLFTASLFNLERTNVTTADNSHTCSAAPQLSDCGNFSVQTGKVRVRGVELEGKISLTNELNATIGYTYMDARVTRSNDGYQGNIPTDTPNNMVTSWLDYRFSSGAMKGLSIGGGARYMGRMFADGANAMRIPDYVLVDGMISYDFATVPSPWKHLKLTLSATNLADRKAIGGCLSSSYCDYVGRRTISGSIGMKF